MQKQTNWILVADDSRGFVLQLTNTGLESIHTFDHPDTRAHASEILTGSRGRRQAPQNRAYASGTPGNHGTAGQRSGMEPQTTRHDVEATRFIEDVRGWLHDAATSQRFDSLILVAAPKTLGRLRDKLTTPVADRVTGSLAKEYTTLSDQELHQRLYAAFPEQVAHPHAGRATPARPQKGNQHPTATR